MTRGRSPDTSAKDALPVVMKAKAQCRELGGLSKGPPDYPVSGTSSSSPLIMKAIKASQLSKNREEVNARKSLKTVCVAGTGGCAGSGSPSAPARCETGRPED